MGKREKTRKNMVTTKKHDKHEKTWEDMENTGSSDVIFSPKTLTLHFLLNSQ